MAGRTAGRPEPSPDASARIRADEREGSDPRRRGRAGDRRRRGRSRRGLEASGLEAARRRSARTRTPASGRARGAPRAGRPRRDRTRGGDASARGAERGSRARLRRTGASTRRPRSRASSAQQPARERPAREPARRGRAHRCASRRGLGEDEGPGTPEQELPRAFERFRLREDRRHAGHRSGERCPRARIRWPLWAPRPLSRGGSSSRRCGAGLLDAARSAAHARR